MDERESKGHGQRIGGILLAAGSSTRFGGDKQLAVFEGRTLLRRAAETMVESGIEPRVAVLGERAAEHAKQLAGLSMCSVVNERPGDGIASSLQVGLSFLQEHAENADMALDAVLLMVCDQPGCTASHLRSLIEEWLRTGKAIVASRYGPTLGVPALFAAEMFAGLLHLKGNRGAGELIWRMREKSAEVGFPEGAMDIDTSEDLERLTMQRPGKVEI